MNERFMSHKNELCLIRKSTFCNRCSIECISPVFMCEFKSDAKNIARIVCLATWLAYWTKCKH